MHQKDLVTPKVYANNMSKNNLWRIHHNRINILKKCVYLENNTSLRLSTLGKIFSRRHFEMFFLFFPENRIRHFMQTVSNGDNLHEMSNPIFGIKLGKKLSTCHTSPESDKG